MPLTPKLLKAYSASLKRRPQIDLDEEESPAEPAEREATQAELAEMVKNAANSLDAPDPRILAAMATYDINDPTPEGFEPEKWQAALEIVAKQKFEGDDPFLVAAHLYKQIGGDVPELPEVEPEE